MRLIGCDLEADLRTLDPEALPPAGAPNIMMAAGGTQLKHILEDDAIYAWKLHVQFDFDTFLPDVDGVALTDARNSGDSDEKTVLRRRLKKDCCYVTDRWFGQFTLFNDINAAASSYVCRVKENSTFEVAEERLLSKLRRGTRSVPRVPHAKTSISRNRHVFGVGVRPVSIR